MNIQQQNTSEVVGTETVMAYNEDLDTSSPQYIPNVFAAADLLSHSSSDSAKYKRAWIKAKEISSSILYAGKCLYACSRDISTALNHKEMAYIMEVTGAIFPEKYANAITRHEQKKKYCTMQHLSVINENK